MIESMSRCRGNARKSERRRRVGNRSASAIILVAQLIGVQASHASSEDFEPTVAFLASSPVADHSAEGHAWLRHSGTIYLLQSASFGESCVAGDGSQIGRVVAREVMEEIPLLLVPDVAPCSNGRRLASFSFVPTSMVIRDEFADWHVNCLQLVVEWSPSIVEPFLPQIIILGEPVRVAHPQAQRLVIGTTDAEGAFSTELEIPLGASTNLNLHDLLEMGERVVLESESGERVLLTADWDYRPPSAPSGPDFYGPHHPCDQWAIDAKRKAFDRYQERMRYCSNHMTTEHVQQTCINWACIGGLVGSPGGGLGILACGLGGWVFGYLSADEFCKMSAWDTLMEADARILAQHAACHAAFPTQGPNAVPPPFVP
jgi:hypothetical protein